MQPIQTRLRRLPVRKDYTVRLLRLDEIICANARDKHVYVRTAEAEERTCYTLTQLEALLPCENFFRIHDSCIINMDFLEEILLLGNHAYAVQLANGLQLPVGRTRYPELLKRLGLMEM